MTEKKRQKNLACLLFVFITAAVPVIGSHTTAEDKYYISLAVGGLLFLPLLFLYMRLSDISAGKSDNIFGYFGSFSPFSGRLLSGIYSLYALVCAVTSIRIYTEEIRMIALFNTPLLFTVIAAAVLYIYTVPKGYNNLSSFAAMYSPLLLIGALFYVLFSVSMYDTGNIEPVLTENLRPMAVSAAGTFTLPFGECVLFLFVLSKGNESTPVEPLRKRYFLFAYAAAFAVVMLIVINTLLVLGGATVNKLYFPNYISASLISVSFFTRVEVLQNMLYFIALNLKAIFALYCASCGIEYTVGNGRDFAAKGKTLLYCIISAAVCAAAVFCFDTAESFFGFLSIYKLSGIAFALLPVILWVIAEIIERMRIKKDGQGKLKQR